MLEVEDAYRAVIERALPLPPHRVDLADALGCVLAEPVAADLDLPPFDKALLDGFAVRSADLGAEGPHRLLVVEEIFAGTTSSRPLGPGEAAAIMTGAPMPPGADAVVMHEKTRRDGPCVFIPGPVRPDEGRLVRGREMKRGEIVLDVRLTLDAAKLGVLAAVGRSRVNVHARPRVAIVPTGDELVPVEATPGPGQIRETNSTVLAAMARSLGFAAAARPAVVDTAEALELALAAALHACDVLIVCGGVSAGERDLVPGAFAKIGVQEVFHKVRLKPGKPLWFGQGPARDDGTSPLVFGLPGNPVGGIVGFLLFVAPALWAMQGKARATWPRRRVRLTAPFHHRGDRPSYHPGRWSGDDAVKPLPSAGSSDLLSVARSDGFLHFPAGARDHPAGAEVDFLPLSP